MGLESDQSGLESTTDSGTDNDKYAVNDAFGGVHAPEQCQANPAEIYVSLTIRWTVILEDRVITYRVHRKNPMNITS